MYTRILDELVRRRTTHWAAVDRLTQIGLDPDRAHYPDCLWGHLEAPSVRFGSPREPLSVRASKNALI